MNVHNSNWGNSAIFSVQLLTTLVRAPLQIAVTFYLQSRYLK